MVNSELDEILMNCLFAGGAMLHSTSNQGSRVVISVLLTNYMCPIKPHRCVIPVE